MSELILELLDMMRVRGTAYVGKNIRPPWNVFIHDDPTFARFHLVLAGSTWVGMDRASDGVQLFPGDMVIIPNGKAHYYYDQRGREVTQASLIPSENAPYFHDLDPDSTDTHLFCGYFQFSSTTPPALLSRLPDMLVERGGTGPHARKFDLLVQLISSEVARGSEPSQAVLNRLTETLTLYAIHNWLDHAMTHDEALKALADPRIKLVIDAIHSEPAEPWTVDSLARVYGQSRTAFAVQFKFATGQAPINYVRQWRIRLASKMLEDTNLPVDEVAFKSGYADANAFNRAFRRETGASPGAYKRISRL